MEDPMLESSRSEVCRTVQGQRTVGQARYDNATSNPQFPGKLAALIRSCVPLVPFRAGKLQRTREVTSEICEVQDPGFTALGRGSWEVRPLPTPVVDSPRPRALIESQS